jgi:hypothetical protein
MAVVDALHQNDTSESCCALCSIGEVLAPVTVRKWVSNYIAASISFGSRSQRAYLESIVHD